MKYLTLCMFLFAIVNFKLTFAKDIKTQPTVNCDSVNLYNRAYILSDLLYNPATGSYTFIKDENKIFPTKVGKIRLNNAISSIYQTYPKNNIYKVIVFNEIKRSKYIDINMHSKNYAIRVSPKCIKGKATNCIIDKITITDPTFSVYDTGLRVGMTLDDLILLYGKNLKLTWKDFNLTVKNNNGIYFILDTENIPKSWFINKNKTLNNLPIKTKIRAIYLTAI